DPNPLSLSLSPCRLTRCRCHCHCVALPLDPLSLSLSPWLFLVTPAVVAPPHLPLLFFLFFLFPPLLRATLHTPMTHNTLLYSFEVPALRGTRNTRRAIGRPARLRGQSSGTNIDDIVVLVVAR